MTDAPALTKRRLRIDIGWRALFYGLLLTIIYLPFAEVGFVGDYIGWKIRVDAGGLLGALHTYDFPGHLQVYAFMMWITERLRPMSPHFIQFAQCMLGGLGAALAATFFTREARRIASPAAGVIGIGAGLLWVCSPGMTEVFAQKNCQHYLLTVVIWFAALLLAGEYLRRRRERHLYAVWGLQLLGVFTLEFSYALPLILAVYLGWRQLLAPDLARASDWGRLVIGPLAIASLHPLATRLYYGVWIGHYGEEVATALPLEEIAAAPWRWMGRYLTFSSYWTGGYRPVFNGLLAQPLTLLTLYSLAVGMAGAVIVRRLRAAKASAGSREAAAWELAVVFLAMTGLATAPMAQLYFVDLLPIESSRLGTLMYLFTGATALMLLAHFGRATVLAFCGAGLLASVYVLQTPLRAWRASQATLDGLVTSARDHLAGLPDTDTVFLLGYANLVRGASLLANLDPESSGFANHVAVMNPETAWPHFIEVAQFNQQTAADSIDAEWAQERIYVSLGVNGAWWWYLQRGLGSYTDTLYDYRVEAHSYHFEVHLGDRWRRRGVTCWHQTGTTWSVVEVPAR